jgi:hypothetical protein
VADSDNHTIRKVAPGGVVTTLAGLAGNPGSADGTGSVARFNNPMGVATDSATDVSGRTNIAGAGINTAQRVMDCGDAGHILLSQHVAHDLMQYRQWAPRLHDLGDCEVKHGVRLHLVNLYAEPLGNAAAPQKFQQSTPKPVVESPPQRSSVGRIAAFALVALLAARARR